MRVRNCWNLNERVFKHLILAPEMSAQNFDTESSELNFPI